MESLASRKAVLVGCGRLGGALLSRWTAEGLHHFFDQLCVVTPHTQLEYQDVTLTGWAKSPEEVTFAAADVIVFAIKPQKAAEIIPAYASLVHSRTLVVTVLTGIPVARYRAWLGDNVTVVRVVTNTPAEVGRATSLLYAPSDAALPVRHYVEKMFGVIGKVAWLEEEAHVEKALALFGSGPAYVFEWIRILQHIGENLGLTPDMVRAFIPELLQGSLQLLEHSPYGLEELIANVVSPGGITDRALQTLRFEERFTRIMEEAILAAHQRALELGK